MKKLAALVLIVGGFYVTSFAQLPQEESITFDKSTPQGVSLVVSNYTLETVKTALQNRFEKTASLKGSNTKGFRAYLAQPFPEFGTKNYDIYTQVVQEGKKKNDQVAIHILVSYGGLNFITSTEDPDVFASVKSFLTSFLQYLKEFDLNQKIAEQSGILASLEKENSTLNSDLEKLHKEQKDIENKIVLKQNAISAKTEEVAKAKEKLAALKAELGN
jgi:PKD repeat protein